MNFTVIILYAIPTLFLYNTYIYSLIIDEIYNENFKDKLKILTY